jgi:hypothetical protein
MEYVNIIYLQANIDGREVYVLGLSPLDRGFRVPLMH